MDKNKQAVLIVDKINYFRHNNGEQLFKQILPIARNIRRLRDRAEAEHVQVIYVNDNFQNWMDTFQSTVEHV